MQLSSRNPGTTESGALPRQRKGLLREVEGHVSCLLFPNGDTAEGVGGWAVAPETSSQAVAEGGEGVQSTGVTGALSCSERGNWLLLTSSAYWTSSTAYFSLKCSLEWILKGKHKDDRSEFGHSSAQAAFPPPSPDHEATPANAWHRVCPTQTQGAKGTTGHRVTGELHLPPSHFLSQPPLLQGCGPGGL